MRDTFRAGAVEIHPLGDDRRLLVGVRSGRAVEGGDADAELLAGCRLFRTLEEHAAAAARRQELQGARNLAAKAPRWVQTVLQQTERTLPPDPRRVEPVTQRLQEFVEAGLLVSRASFVRDSGQAPPPSAPPLQTVGFTTRNRPELLQRTIESWGRNAEAFGRPIEFTVIDDARDEAEGRATQQMLQQLAGQGVALRCASPADRDAYADALAAEAQTDPELVRFALRGRPECPISTGSARNCLLLDSAGDPYVLADDDGMAQLAACPEALPGLEVASRNDPTEFWFYRDREHRAATVELLDRDLLGEHERLLGHAAGDLIAVADASGALELSTMSVPFEGRLRVGGVRVRTSMAGVVGDSGIGATAHLFTSLETRNRLTESEAVFEAAVRNRQSLRVPHRLTLSDGVVTMAGNLGLDATTLLPPFCPVQRNSDGLLGRTLQRCFPSSCKGYLNVAAVHDPPQGRTQSLEDWWLQLQQVRFPEIAAVLIEDFEPGPGAGSEAGLLQSLGRRLQQAAALPRAEFQGRIWGLLLRRESPRLLRDRSHESREMPEFYVSLRMRQIETIREAIATPRYLEPRDLPGEEPLALAQDVAGRFGALLEAWPRIWDAAVRLRARGRRLAQPVRKG